MAKRSRHKGTVKLVVSADLKKLQEIAKVDGGKRLRKQLRAEFKKAAAPVRKAQKAYAMSLPRIPKHMKRKVANSVSVQLRTGARTAGVTLRVTRRKDKGQVAKDLNRGRIHHPLFGNRKHWYPQYTLKGWFDGPIEKHGEEFKQAVVKAINEVYEISLSLDG